MPNLAEHFEELIRRASTTLPPDIEQKLKEAADAEGDTPAGATLRQMLDNAAQASQGSTPICQDTGTPIFYLDYGPDYRQKVITEAINEAAASATGKYYLRPNAVDPITGKNSGNNIGEGMPYIHFHEMDEPGIRARLMLKGGGSENVGAQYRLPDSALHAGRDLEGVRKWSSTRCSRPRARGAPRAPWAWASAVIAAPPSRRPRSSSSVPSDDTNPDPTAGRAGDAAVQGAQRAGHRAHGLRRQDHGAGRQDRHPPPRARVILCLGGLHLLGLPSGLHGPFKGEEVSYA